MQQQSKVLEQWLETEKLHTEVLTEEKIVQLATSKQATNDEESYDDERNASDTTMVSHAEVVHALDTCIRS